MFDSVGHNLDEGAAVRRAQSMGIVMMLGIAVAVSVVLAGLWTATEKIVQEIVGEEVSLVEMMEESIEPEAAPPPPPPPPPPPAAAEPEPEDEPEDDEPDDPEPDEMIEEVEELKEEIKEEIKEADRPKGQEGGVEGGEEGGEVGGVLGGQKGGVVGGELGGSAGPKVIHHSQLEIKRKVEPRYPSAAKGLGLGDQRCRTRIRIDDSGVPYKVEVSGCPNVFHGVVKDAILKWRWYPAREGRAKISAQTTIMVIFKETG